MSADPRLDTRAHMAALRAALDATLGAGLTHEWGQVPGDSDTGGSLPAMWVLVSVQRRQNASHRAPGDAPMTLWRTTVAVVGSTPAEARWLLYKVATALNEEPVTIGGVVSTPLQYESERSPARDEGRYYAAAVYTYAL